MTTGYKWHRIEDFSEDPKSLTDGELEALKRVWANQRAELIESGALEEFDKRLRREWAIETGMIEDVYRLDRGVTRTLIEKGIDAALIPHGASNRDSTLVARIIQDQYEALEGLLDFVGGRRQLSTGYVKELHAALLRNQESHTVVDQLGRAFEKRLELGKYKDAPNSPTRPDGAVHEYSPPEHVASEMERLLEMHARHEAEGVPVEVEAAWLHHRFSQIHPFADGNGRVARALASMVFIKSGWFPLVIRSDDKARYIDALEKADRGDLRHLISIFVESQRNAVIQATEIAFDVKPVSTEDEAVAAVRDRLLGRGKIALKEWLEAKTTANDLVQFSVHRLEKTARLLNEEIGRVGTGFNFGAGGGAQGGYDDVRARMVQKAGQVADFTDYNAMAQLAMNAGRYDSLTISFQAIGPRFRGIIGVVAYLSIHDAEPILIPGGTFQINYAEDVAKAQTRFSNWLDHVIVEGLNQWRRTL
ncbi:MAG: filamentation induced by cAMP protein fic [Terriglobia bacterium]|nr:MAG: filamentation induced by cAMP protein fic [Terriglobia bacterium]